MKCVLRRTYVIWSMLACSTCKRQETSLWNGRWLVLVISLVKLSQRACKALMQFTILPYICNKCMSFLVFLQGSFCQSQLKVGLAGTGKCMELTFIYWFVKFYSQMKKFAAWAYCKSKRWCQLPTWWLLTVCPPETYESNFIHDDFVQFRKQHLRLKATLSSIVLSQQCCEMYFISLTVAKPLWDFTTTHCRNRSPLKLLVGSPPGSESDASVIFFVSGYIDRSISHRRKCPHCKELLVEVWCSRTSRMCAEKARPTFRNC